MGNKNQGLGNAANVRQELEKKAAAEAAAKMAAKEAAKKDIEEEEALEDAEGDDDAADEKETPKEEPKTAVVKRTAPVKLTDLLLQVVKAASYIPKEHLDKLVGSIEAALENTGSNKPSVKDFVKNLLTNADPKKGISKGAMTKAFTLSEFMKGIDPDSDQYFEKMNAFVTQMSFFVMPSYYKKEGWNLVAIEGGGFAILPKK